ncbi:MAG: EutN/CcmL family microcompartment protein, partial [Geitlerinemataceae cyanobacterium]
KYEVVADSVGAGFDEWVLVSRRAIAPQPEDDLRPIDAMIIGIIDTVTLENRRMYSKKDEYR